MTLQVEMARIGASLDSLNEEVRDLVIHVREQNGRVGKIETICSAHQVMGIKDVQEHAEFATKIEKLDDRVDELNNYKNMTTGMGKASTGILRDVVMILTLVLAIWQMTDSKRHSVDSSVTQTQQRKP